MRKKAGPQFLEKPLRETGQFRRLGLAVTSGHHYLTGPNGLNDLKLTKHHRDSIKLACGAREHCNHGGRTHIDGFSSEMLNDLKGGGALITVSENLHEEHFTDDGIGSGVLEAMDYIDELVDLLDDLVQSVGMTRDVDGHPGKGARTTLGNDQRIDVVGATGENLTNAHEDSRTIVDEDR